MGSRGCLQEIVYRKPRTRMGRAAVQSDEMSGGEWDIRSRGMRRGDQRRTVRARCTGVICAEDGRNLHGLYPKGMHVETTSKLHPFSTV